MLIATANVAKSLPFESTHLRVANPIRLAILVSHPIQYFAPVYRALAKRSDIDLTVLFHCKAGAEKAFDTGFGQTVKWDIPLLDGYNHRFLSSRPHTGGLRLNIARTLVKQRPDILIIHGYNSATNLLALGLCRLLGIKTLLRGDTRFLTHHKAQSQLARWAKRTILRSFDGCLSIGTLNRDYYLAHCVPPSEIFHTPFCVDNSRFGGDLYHTDVSRKAKRSELRFGERDVVVLFASKLVRRKRASDLVSAFAKLAPRHPHLRLLIAGAGEEGSLLKETASAVGLQERITLLGFVNQSQLPALYAASDIFVFPAEDEPWGLVLNEVMAAGLPVIVSDGVGAATDLVQGKNTGIIYPVGDIAALGDAITRLTDDQALRLSMGKRASALMADWDVAACVQGTLHALSQILCR